MPQKTISTENCTPIKLGFYRKTLLLLYNTVIMSKLDNGVTVYGRATPATRH